MRVDWVRFPAARLSDGEGGPEAAAEGQDRAKAREVPKPAAEGQDRAKAKEVPKPAGVGQDRNESE